MEEPATKRPRLGEESVQQQPADTELVPAPAPIGPNITSLFHVPAGLKREPSPGAMHGCRIVAHAIPGSTLEYASAFASGASIYWSQVALQQHAVPDAGKEGVLLPVRLQAPPAVQLQQLQHVAEVQALALTPLAAAAAATEAEQHQHQQQLLLATVDAFGQGTISRLQLASSFGQATAAESWSGAAGATTSAAPDVTCQQWLRPLDGCWEGGWAGIAFSSNSSSGSSSSSDGACEAGLLLATARGFEKDISIFDAATGSVVRTFGCALNPHALRFLPSGAGSSNAGGGSNILAVAEGHMLSLWDVRAPGSAAAAAGSGGGAGGKGSGAGGGSGGGGCVMRVAVGTPGNPLYTLDWCEAQGGLLGAAGAERSLFMTELRKGRVVSKWHGAARQAVHSLSFLQRDASYAVLAGLDMEVLCGRWDKPAGSNSRAFQSMVPGEDEQPVAAPAPAAPGAPGSGDRTRGAGGSGAAAAAAAAAGNAGAGGAGGSSSAGGFSFRGDSRWLGVAKAAGEDVLAGFAASGNLVYARVS